MNRLISSTTMPVDAVTDVREWYVAEGKHDRAAREQFEQAAAMLLGRKSRFLDSTTFDSGVALLRYEPVERPAR